MKKLADRCCVEGIAHHRGVFLKSSCPETKLEHESGNKNYEIYAQSYDRVRIENVSICKTSEIPF